MFVGLHDSEKEHFKHKKTFPNYALMKISAYHKAKGDSVEWWDPAKDYDLVYSSKIFDFTEENKDLPPDTIKGGTGYDIEKKLPQEIDDMYPDYSIYPDCDYAIGYITRGCPNKCPWCYVPRKEGNIKPYRRWTELVRYDTPDLILMDNNILASEYGIGQLKDMAGKGWRIDLNQGMDARLVTEEIADVLASLQWIKYIRFSCDTVSQVKHIDRVAELLAERGIKPYRLFVYLLVRKDLDFENGFLKAYGIYIDPGKWIDPMVIFARIYGEYDSYHDSYKWQKLSKCADYYGYKFKAHDSLEDAKATLYCYKKMEEGREKEC